MHIKGNSDLKACRADMPLVCWGKHYTYACHYVIEQAMGLLPHYMYNTEHFTSQVITALACPHAG